MKITRAEADLIEKLRRHGCDPAIMAENIDSLQRGFGDMSKFLCSRCATILEKVLMFRAAVKR